MGEDLVVIWVMNLVVVGGYGGDLHGHGHGHGHVHGRHEHKTQCNINFTMQSKNLPISKWL